MFKYYWYEYFLAHSLLGSLYWATFSDSRVVPAAQRLFWALHIDKLITETKVNWSYLPWHYLHIKILQRRIQDPCKPLRQSDWQQQLFILHIYFCQALAAPPAYLWKLLFFMQVSFTNQMLWRWDKHQLILT